MPGSQQQGVVPLWGPRWSSGAPEALVQAIAAVRRGEPLPADSAVRAAAEAVDLWAPALPSAEPAYVSERVPTDDVLARLVLDVAPVAGEDATEAILGPWLPALDLATPEGVGAWRGAVAQSACALHEDQRRVPMRSRTKELKAMGRRHERRRLHAIVRAPLAPWRVLDGDHLEPLLPLSPRVLPPGPVDLTGVGGVGGGPQPGGLLLARVVPLESGAWVARTALALPACPPPAVFAAWWAAVDWPQRHDTAELRVDDLLRRGGHHLSALAHRWWWREAARGG